MQVDPYTNREIDSKFEQLLNKSDQILVQTTEHNHRMTKSEAKILVGIGGLSVVTFLVIPMLVFYISSVESRIEKIESIFTTYDIEIIP